jgi:hypothetical protein
MYGYEDGLSRRRKVLTIRQSDLKDLTVVAKVRARQTANASLHGIQSGIMTEDAVYRHRIRTSMYKMSTIPPRSVEACVGIRKILFRNSGRCTAEDVMGMVAVDAEERGEGLARDGSMKLRVLRT